MVMYPALLWSPYKSRKHQYDQMKLVLSLHWLRPWSRFLSSSKHPVLLPEHFLVWARLHLQTSSQTPRIYRQNPNLTWTAARTHQTPLSQMGCLHQRMDFSHQTGLELVHPLSFPSSHKLCVFVRRLKSRMRCWLNQTFLWLQEFYWHPDEITSPKRNKPFWYHFERNLFLLLVFRKNLSFLWQSISPSCLWFHYVL